MHIVHLPFELATSTKNPEQSERLSDEEHLQIILSQNGLGKKFIKLHEIILRGNHQDYITINATDGTECVYLLDMYQTRFFNPFQESPEKVKEISLNIKSENVSPRANTNLLDYLQSHGLFKIGRVSKPDTIETANIFVRGGTLFLSKNGVEIPLQIVADSLLVPSQIWQAAQGLHVYHKMMR